MVPGTIFIVVRHGETEWNVALRIQGQGDSRLTEQGRSQAEAIGRRLAAEPFDALLSSDLGRARLTAERIAAHSGRAMQLDPRLRERHFGEGEGMTYQEVGRRYPDAFERIDVAIPGGESRLAFHERVTRAFEDLARAHAGQRLVVVTHGGVLGAMYRHAKGIPVAEPHRMPITNAGFNRLAWRDGRWSVEAWADAAHLEADEPFEEN